MCVTRQPKIENLDIALLLVVLIDPARLAVAEVLGAARFLLLLSNVVKRNFEVGGVCGSGFSGFAEFSNFAKAINPVRYRSLRPLYLFGDFFLRVER